MADDESRGPAPPDERGTDDDRDLSGGDRHDAGGPFLDEGGYDEGHARQDPGNPLWDEGLIVLLLAAGVVLLLFPEPATSGLGVLLIAVGLLAWLVDAIG